MAQRGQRRTESVASAESYAPSQTTTQLLGGAVGIGGGGVGGGIGDSEFKDTVLFMQQQQAMQNQELITLLQRMESRMGGGAADNHAATSSFDATVGRRSPSAGHSSADPLLGSAYVIQRVKDQQEPIGGSGGASLASRLQQAELHAARSRIADLEDQVGSLQRQLQSKEDALQRLADAAVSNSAYRFSASESVGSALKAIPPHLRSGSTPTPVAATSNTSRVIVRGTDDGTSSVPFMLTPTKAIHEHERSVHRLLSTSPSTPPPPPPSAARSILPAAASGGCVGIDSSRRDLGNTAELQELLKEHQHRCNVLSHH